MAKFTFTMRHDIFHSFTVEADSEKVAWVLADEEMKDYCWVDEDFETEIVSAFQHSED
jgi:hypothetical protein